MIEQMATMQLSTLSPIPSATFPSQQERVEYLDAIIDGLTRIRDRTERGDSEREGYYSRQRGRDYTDDDDYERRPRRRRD